MARNLVLLSCLSPLPTILATMDLVTMHFPPNTLPTGMFPLPPSSTNIGLPPRGNRRAYLSVSSIILFSTFRGVDESASISRRNDLQIIGGPPPLSMDLAEEIKGLYRLLDVISEYGSNGCGNKHIQHAIHVLADLPST